MLTPKNCPKCNVNLDGEDIYLELLKEYKDEKKALECAELYGWSEANPLTFSRCLGIYCTEEEMVIEWECPDCEHKWEAR